MAFKPGYLGDFRLDTAAGALTNIQPYIDTVSVPNSVDMLDVSVLGTAAKASIAGMTDGDTIAISGPYDPAIVTHLGALKAAQAAGTASHSWQYGPGGSVASQSKITGECLLQSFSLSTGVGGRAEWSASLQVTGPTVISTF